MDEPRRLPRRDRNQTRELLLLAGALLADETVARTDEALLGQWLSHVRLEDVLDVAKRLQLYLEVEAEDARAAAVASTVDEVTARSDRWWVREHRREVLGADASGYRGIAPSTAYTVFDSEQDFREQLARALLSAERVNDTAPLEAAYAALVAEFGGTPPFDVMLGELAAVELERVRQLDSVYVELGAVPFAGHPLIRELLASTLHEAADPEVEGSHAALYEQLLRAYGWRLRGGLEVADLVVALYSLTQGYLFFDRLWPAGVREVPAGSAGSRTGSAYSRAVIGVLRQFAEPATAAAPSDPGR